MAVKVVADSLPNAEAVLTEALGFMEAVDMLREAVAPYSLNGNGRTLPRFIAETSVLLKQRLIKDFSVFFPSISNLIENGAGSTAGMGRLHDACYFYNKVQKEIHNNGCMLKSDDIRGELYEQLQTITGDIIVFICIQYGLYALDSGEVTMAISKHCERCKFTPDVFYGVLIGTLEEVDRSWYAYEPISPMYQALNEFDPNFASECEESMYPLTDAMAKDLVEGRVDVAKMRAVLVKFNKETCQVDVDVTPATLVSQMRLE